MHEYPITKRIVDMACDACQDAKGEKVKTIKLVMGDYSGFVAESMYMYFDLISQGTACEGARLDIERIRPKLKCPNCGIYFERPHMSFACPECGTDGEPSEIGKEFYVDSIEVE